MLDLNKDALNPSQIDQALDAIIQSVIRYGLDIAAAILILVVGWSLANWTRRFIRNRLSRLPRADATLNSFLSSFAKYIILIITLIAVLSQFGVQTTSLIAVLGAAGLAIGLALQGTLSNVAAGVMLLIFRPFRVGDTVEVQGASGTVRDMSLFITEIDTPNNQRITVPNGLIWANAVTNLSINDTRRIDISLGVGYDTKLDHVFAILNDIMASDPRILKDPPAEVHLGNFGASSLDLVVRAWTRSADHWPTRFALYKAIKERFDAENIEIPFPHQVEIQKLVTAEK